MNRHEAKNLAETVTADELRQMFLNAQSKITDWHQAAHVNKGLSKGKAFNILSACLKEDIKEMRELIKTNMIWELGEYLPGYSKPIRKKPTIVNQPFYEAPIFLK